MKFNDIFVLFLHKFLVDDTFIFISDIANSLKRKKRGGDTKISKDLQLIVANHF